MSVSKHLVQEFCLLFALNKAHKSDEKLERTLLKKVTGTCYNFDQLAEASRNCSQHICIAVTNDLKWFFENLKRNMPTVENGTFFVVSTDSSPYKVPALLKKHIEQVHQLEITDFSRANLIKQIKVGIRRMKKEVARHLKAKIAQEALNEPLADTRFLEAFMSILSEHYHTKTLRTTFIAKSLGISQSTLERRCFKLTGKQPNQLLLEYRLSKAYLLCEQSLMPFADISKKCGFGSPLTSRCASRNTTTSSLHTYASGPAAK